MDLPVWLFVLIVVGAVILGILIAAVATRRSRNAARKAHIQMRETVARIQGELDDAVESSRQELTRANELRLDRDTAAAEVDRLAAQVEELTVRLDRERDRNGVLARELDTFKSRFTDIAGMESEIAMLRVIAARVPELERTIVDLTEDEDPAIDQRDHARGRPD